MKELRFITVRSVILLLVLLCLFACVSCKSTEEKQSDTEKVSATVPETDTETAKEAATEKEKTGELKLSETGCFYSETIELKIDCDVSCEIFYTMDGTLPDERSLKYTGKIEFICRQKPKCCALSVRAKYEDGSWSDVIRHSYIIGDNVKDEFDVPVFSMITDPYNLYDYEYGIFTDGKLRDDYIKNNPYAPVDPSSPANWGMRGRAWEREAFLEVLIPETGSCEISQNVGIRVCGGWSRSYESKPIKIYAREEYGTKKLDYAFFPDAISQKSGELITKYKRLILRNSGSDFGRAYLRDELIQRLAAKAGVYGTECVAPALLYVNGKLQGAYWMHEAYCDEYFKQRYGKFDGYFCINRTKEHTYTKNEETREERKAMHDYNKAYEFGCKCDVNDDADYEKLCSLFDIESYLRLWAVQIFIGNYDWPSNNSLIYRYYAAEGEEYQSDGPFDGRWHFCLHDTDFGLGLVIDPTDDLLSIQNFTSQPKPMFKNLIKRQECRDYYLSFTESLINGAFSAASVNEELVKMNGESLKAFELFSKYANVSTKPDMDALIRNRQNIATWAKRRCYHMKNNYISNLDRYMGIKKTDPAE